MRPEELRRVLDNRPFQPVRLHITGGEFVDVRHPEMAIITRSLVTVGIAGHAGVFDHIAHYNLLHVVKIEPLNGANHRPKKTGDRRQRK